MGHASRAGELGLDFNRSHQLHRWRISGAVTPSIRDASGSGSRVEWSDFDLARLRCLFDLYDQFHAADLLLPYNIVYDVWEALERGETWSLAFEVALVPA